MIDPNSTVAQVLIKVFGPFVKSMMTPPPGYMPTGRWWQWAHAIDPEGRFDTTTQRWVYEGSVLEYSEHFEIGGEG